MRDLIDKPQIVVAVDPGLSGAVARVGGGSVAVRRDFKSLRDISTAICDLTRIRCVPDHLIIEQVGARPGQGVKSMFSFGKSTGTAFGSLYSHIPCREVEEVHPLRWQNFYKKKYREDQWGVLEKQEDGTTALKFGSRKLVLHLLPEYADLFKRKKDHNTADAVLIGLWKLAQLN